MFMPKPNGNDDDYQIAPAGTHLAVCYYLVDLGTQPKKYKGEVSHVHQVRIGWELSSERMEDGRPFSVFESYPYLSSPRARLRKDLESWRGQPFKDSDLTGGEGSFNLKDIVGAPCMLSIVHNEHEGRMYANLRGVMKKPKEIPAPTMENGEVFLSMASLMEFDQETFDGLPSWLRDKIAGSPEYQRLFGGASPSHSSNGAATTSSSPAAHDELNPPPHEPDLDDEIPF